MHAILISIMLSFYMHMIIMILNKMEIILSAVQNFKKNLRYIANTCMLQLSMMYNF